MDLALAWSRHQFTEEEATAFARQWFAHGGSNVGGGQRAFTYLYGTLVPSHHADVLLASSASANLLERMLPPGR